MKINHSIMTGLCFGLTSGIITTLGLMVGLSAGTQSKLVVIGGILTIAIADAFSDALGIHVSEESEGKHTAIEIWQSTLSTFCSKFIFAMTFIVPLLLFNLYTAIYISLIWGFSVLGLLSYQMGRAEKGGPWKVVLEHLLIAVLVVSLTHYVGSWISTVFG